MPGAYSVIDIDIITVILTDQGHQQDGIYQNSMGEFQDLLNITFNQIIYCLKNRLTLY